MDADNLILMLDTGWSLRDIATHYSLPVTEIERLIVERLKAERWRLDSLLLNAWIASRLLIAPGPSIFASDTIF